MKIFEEITGEFQRVQFGGFFRCSTYLENGNYPRSSMALMHLWAIHIPSKPLLQKNEWDPESYEILHPNASECVTPNNVILSCNQMDVRI